MFTNTGENQGPLWDGSQNHSIIIIIIALFVNGTRNNWRLCILTMDSVDFTTELHGLNLIHMYICTARRKVIYQVLVCNWRCGGCRWTWTRRDAEPVNLTNDINVHKQLLHRLARFIFHVFPIYNFSLLPSSILHVYKSNVCISTRPLYDDNEFSHFPPQALSLPRNPLVLFHKYSLKMWLVVVIARNSESTSARNSLKAIIFFLWVFFYNS